MKVAAIATAAILMVSTSTITQAETTLETEITTLLEGIAKAADDHAWDRLNLKFTDHIILNQLSLATQSGARVDEQTLIATWAALLPKFDETHHAVTDIEVLASSSLIARVTARYHATYHLNSMRWEQTGRLNYVLKLTEKGWQVTALETVPAWESGALTDLLSETAPETPLS
ncbi:nuclear transport factor 2 family protein [uncultured Roseobacter sp.]|uniref:nuclear transport factor 2 family protein n=1 Tax=uncultured Roseobacter sp. TaxID=114847 RepID=UPI002605E27C|nr:nuclear transport factor 2 family protein [uncultured Roseobacter sp.]